VRPHYSSPEYPYSAPDGQSAARHEDEHNRLIDQWANAVALRVTLKLRLKRTQNGIQAKLTVSSKTVLPKNTGGEHFQPEGLEVRAASSTEMPDREHITDEEAAKDPLLARKRRLNHKPGPKSQGNTSNALNRALADIAATYDLNLVADAYRHPWTNVARIYQPRELPLYEALNLSTGKLSNWTKKGDFIRVRRRTWFNDRLAEIPERLAEEWAERLRKSPQAGLIEQADMAAQLREEQFENFQSELAERGVDFGFWLAFWLRQRVHFLRAYHALRPDERRVLRLGGALQVARLSPAVRRDLLQAMRYVNRDRDTPWQPGKDDRLFGIELVYFDRNTRAGRQQGYARKNPPGRVLLRFGIQPDPSPLPRTGIIRDVSFGYAYGTGEGYFTIVPILPKISLHPRPATGDWGPKTGRR